MIAPEPPKFWPPLANLPTHHLPTIIAALDLADAAAAGTRAERRYKDALMWAQNLKHELANPDLFAR